MKYLARYTSLLILFITCSVLTLAQGFKVESKNPPKATGSETFTSLDSRFSIALPQQVSGFGPISVDTPKGKTTIGSSYMWRLEGMQFQIGHVDYSSAPNASGDPKAVIGSVAGEVAAETVKKGGKLVSNAEVQFQGGVAREVRVEFPDGSMLVNRVLAANRQLYQVLVTFKKDPKLEESAAKILDSFRALSPADADAAIRKRVEEATPSPLPEEPAAKRPKSDAEDEGLNGRVKTVFTESEDLSGTWAVQRRKPSLMEYYDERGYLTKRESYDYKGNPSDITVYGYLGGERVSKIGSVSYEYNPPPMMVAGPSGPAGPEPKSDTRYTYKFKYKYDDKGRLAEKAWLHNDGMPWLRYVYNYKGKQREELVYSANGSLNQKYVVTLDDKGNEVEEIIYQVKDDSVRSKQSSAYELDAQGNWTKKTVSKWMTKDGKSYYEPSHVYYRTITYY